MQRSVMNCLVSITESVRRFRIRSTEPPAAQFPIDIAEYSISLDCHFDSIEFYERCVSQGPAI